MSTLMNTISARLVEPARWVVVALIAYTLATSVLYFISPPQTDPVAQDPAAATDSRHQATNINDILARNLFGVADASAAKPLESQAAATETRLPLELHGVFVAEVHGDSAAIVAQKGKPGILYAIGQTLPGNAELVEVHSDHIVLRRGGARETLTFPEVKAQLVANSANSTAVFDPADAGDFPGNFEPEPDQRHTDSESAGATNTRDFVSDYRELIDNDPDGALSGLGLAPVAEGASSGYRLSNLADSPYLSQTGLQPGDVILSVNGRPVGDIRQDKMEIDNVLAQGSARLEVQRGTRRFFVTASLK